MASTPRSARGQRAGGLHARSQAPRPSRLGDLRSRIYWPSMSGRFWGLVRWKAIRQQADRSEVASGRGPGILVEHGGDIVRVRAEQIEEAAPPAAAAADGSMSRRPP